MALAVKVNELEITISQVDLLDLLNEHDVNINHGNSLGLDFNNYVIDSVDLIQDKRSSSESSIMFVLQPKQEN